MSSFEADIIVGTALLNMYGKCGALEDACRVFDNHLSLRDTIAWTIMISIYAQHGRAKESLSLFDKMRKEGVEPNEVTYISILNACSHSGLVDQGQMHFENMSQKYGITPDVDHLTCMIDLFGRAGYFDKLWVCLRRCPL